MAGDPPPGLVDVDWQIPLYVIHSRADEIVPLESTQAVVDRLRENGASVEWVVLDDITPYQTGRFVDLLRAVVPWIKKAWQ
jgi:predicted esterase